MRKPRKIIVDGQEYVWKAYREGANVWLNRKIFCSVCYEDVFTPKRIEELIRREMKTRGDN